MSSPHEVISCSEGYNDRALVDGKYQPIDNRVAEGSMLFLGRGDNPMSGRIKMAPTRSDITINLSRGKHKTGGGWHAMVNYPTVDWLAKWNDSLTGRTKYMRLASTSELHQRSAWEKFNRVWHLGTLFDPEKVPVNDRGGDGDGVHGLCLSLMWQCALRAGGEKTLVAKNSREEWGIGATTLQHGHLSYRTINGIPNFVLNFVGKDNIRLERKFPFVETSPFMLALRNLVSSGETEGTKLFEGVTAASLNRYIQKSYGHVFSARDFRTLRACVTYRDALNVARGNTHKYSPKHVISYANAQVAMLLNHRSEMKSRNTNIVAVDAPIVSVRPIGTFGDRISAKVQEQGLILSTSRKNYIDPRLTVAFCTRHPDTRGGPVEEVAWPLETERKMFKWALRLIPGFEEGLPKININQV
jgi:hypothetical protein